MYHVAATVIWSSGKMRIFVNGHPGEVSIATNAVAYEYMATPWRFGAASPSGDWSYPADGAIDEVRLSSTARPRRHASLSTAPWRTGSLTNSST
jgi:hypothetical protein